MMPSERGFSMIELMVGLVILAMLMALGAPSFNNWILNSQIRNAAEELQNGLLVARSNGLRLNGIAPQPDDNPSNSPAYQIPQQTIAGARNAVLQVTPEGVGVLNFDGLGRPREGALTIDIGSAAGNGCFAAGGNLRCLRVVVTTMGQVKMCDPVRASTDPQGCPN